MNSLVIELSRLWEQNSLFCIHRYKEVHTDHNEVDEMDITGNDWYLEKHLYYVYPLYEVHIIFITITFCSLKLFPDISGFLV